MQARESQPILFLQELRGWRIQKNSYERFKVVSCIWIKLVEKQSGSWGYFRGGERSQGYWFICKVGQPWLHKLSMKQLLSYNQIKPMSNYNYLFIPTATFPTFYYLTLPSQTLPEQPPTDTHLQVSHQQPHPPRTLQSLELSEQELLAAGYERKKRVWTAEEDQRLMELVGSQNIAWRQIQEHMPQRTQKMCYSRYRRLLAEARQRWAPQDQKRLKQLVEAQGEDWKLFAPLFPNRTWKQLRDKYVNYLRPDINREEWSLQEDQKILELIGKYGTKWKSIQQEMGSRTDNQIKNRYYGRLKMLLKRKARRHTQAP